MIGPNVTLATPMHPFLLEERNSRKREDGSFYMGDYLGAEKGCLKESRFDKVYLSDHPKEKKDKDS